MPLCLPVLDRKMSVISRRVFIIKASRKIIRLMGKRGGLMVSMMINSFFKKKNRMVGIKHQFKILFLLIQMSKIIYDQLSNKKLNLDKNKIINNCQFKMILIFNSKIKKVFKDHRL